MKTKCTKVANIPKLGGKRLARHKHYMKKAFVDGDDPVTGCQERYQCCRVNITASVLGKVYK